MKHLKHLRHNVQPEIYIYIYTYIHVYIYIYIANILAIEHTRMLALLAITKTGFY